MFKKNELTLLWPFYLAEFMAGVTNVIWPFWIVYFSLQGFSYTQISAAVSLIFLTPILFEIPTGAIADHFGRKVSVCISWGGAALIFFLVPFVESYSTLLFLFFLWGILDTFYSGADEAWVVDNLTDHTHLVQEFYIKRMSVSSIAQIVAPLIGSAIVLYWNMDVLWFIQSAGFVGATVSLALAAEQFTPTKLAVIDSIKRTYSQSKEGLHYAYTHKTIWFLSLAIGFVALHQGLFMMSWQPMYAEVGIATALFGVIYSLGYALSAVLPFFSKRLVLLLGREVYVLVVVVVLMMGFSFTLLFSTNPFWISFVSIVLSALYVLIFTVEGPYFQHFLKSKLRATVGSVKSLLMRLGSGLALLGGGLLLDVFGPRNVIVYSSLVLLPSMYFYLKIKQ